MVDWIIEIVDWALRLSLWSADWWLLRFFAFTLSILQWQSLNLFQISYFRKSALKKLRVSNIVGKTSCFSVGYQRQFNYLSSCLTSPQHSDHCDDEYRFSHYRLTFSKKAFYLQLRRFTASLVCVIWENRVFCCLSWISCIAYVNFLPLIAASNLKENPAPFFLFVWYTRQLVRAFCLVIRYWYILRLIIIHKVRFDRSLHGGSCYDKPHSFFAPPGLSRRLPCTSVVLLAERLQQAVLSLDKLSKKKLRYRTQEITTFISTSQ